MNPFYKASLVFLTISLSSCDKKEKVAEKEKAAPDMSELSAELQKADMPILPLKKGDTWKYRVNINVPEGVTAGGKPVIGVEGEQTRTYIGKVKLGDAYPEVDAFDVRIPGEPIQRELVEIYDDRVLMRGTINPEEPDAKPMWLENPVVFVFAGMRPGLDVAKFSVQEGARDRKIQVVAREKITVEAGEFSTIRLLMTGHDGEFELRKTTWFAPKIGIVKEERLRYGGEKLLFRETIELVETSVKIQ